jgi:NTE family protein
MTEEHAEATVQDTPPPRIQAGPDFASRTIDEEAEGFPVPGLERPDVGLALSGGGLRAMLYHLGALWRLRELGYLKEIDAYSGVSGGAIMVAILAKAWRELERDDFSEATFQRLVVKPALRFSGRKIDAWVIGLGLVPTVKPAHVLEWVLRTRLLGDTRLDELPDRPRFIFNAANVATGVSWVFQKAYMGDARLGIVKSPHVKLADAVAASASFPPVVAPFWLDLPENGLLPIESADLHESAGETGLADQVLLLDGGAYDNLGIEPIEGRCEVVLASSAGGNLKVDTRRDHYRFMWPLLRRTLDMAVEVGRAQRRRALIDRAKAEFSGGGYRTRHVALWRTSNDVREESDQRTADWVPLPDGFVVADGWNDYVASLKTRLWPMPLIDRQRLINWGYLTSDIMVRSYVPALMDDAPPVRYPFEGVRFEGPPPPAP